MADGLVPVAWKPRRRDGSERSVVPELRHDFGDTANVRSDERLRP